METDITEIRYWIEGASDIMFDRFIDHGKDIRPPEQKLYLDQDNRLVLPQDNIDAFLFGMDPQGCAKKFEGKKYADYLAMGKSHVFVKESMVPFEQNGKPVVVKGDLADDKRFYIKLAGGRTKGAGNRSTKQEARPRPVLRLPWALRFTLVLAKNPLIDETKLFNWLTQGGILIALGTWRPNYGRFFVKME